MKNEEIRQLKDMIEQLNSELKSHSEVIHQHKYRQQQQQQQQDQVGKSTGMATQTITRKQDNNNINEQGVATCISITTDMDTQVDHANNINHMNQNNSDNSSGKEITLQTFLSNNDSINTNHIQTMAHSPPLSIPLTTDSKQPPSAPAVDTSTVINSNLSTNNQDNTLIPTVTSSINKRGFSNSDNNTTNTNNTSNQSSTAVIQPYTRQTTTTNNNSMLPDSSTQYIADTNNSSLKVDSTISTRQYNPLSTHSQQQQALKKPRNEMNPFPEQSTLFTPNNMTQHTANTQTDNYANTTTTTNNNNSSNLNQTAPITSMTTTLSNDNKMNNSASTEVSTADTNTLESMKQPISVPKKSEECPSCKDQPYGLMISCTICNSEYHSACVRKLRLAATNTIADLRVTNPSFSQHKKGEYYMCVNYYTHTLIFK